MSKNTGHYLKPARRYTSPAVVFSIVVNTQTVERKSVNTHYEPVFKSAVITVTKKRRGKWSKPQWIETDDCEELRDWHYLHADTKRRNYTICPVASDVLTLTNWWSYATSRGIRYIPSESGDPIGSFGNGNENEISVRRALLRGKPDIFDYSDCDKRFIWLSGCQYSEASESSIAETIGYKQETSLFGVSEAYGPRYTTLDRALIWSQFLCHLANWWSTHSSAPFGLTVGSLSMGILRSHIKPKTLSTHKDEYVHKLERSACFGGRSSVWFVGAIGSTHDVRFSNGSIHRRHNTNGICGPARLVDVRSMYPYLLAHNLFPYRYAGRLGKIRPDEIRDILQHYGIVARCIVYSWSGEYPTRKDNRVIYPRGYVQTTLTGPELLAIRGRDKLVAIIDGAKYYLGKPFADAARALLDMRLDARKARNTAWEMFAKSVGNNLGGKLAQRKSVWKPRPDVPPAREWGEWIVSDMSAGTHTRYRSIGGLVSEQVRDDIGYGPYTASFAYLTAYGRLHMREIREKCVPESVVSQDTDGIWIVGNEAYNKLRDKFAFGNDPGMLAIKHESAYAQFFSPRHYYTEQGWTLAGFHNPSVNPETMVVTDTYTVNPLTIGCRESPNRLIEMQRASKLSLEDVGGTVQPDGWVRPYYFPPPADYQD